MSGEYNTIDMEAPGLQMVLSMAELDPTVLSGLIESVLENSPSLMAQLEKGVSEKSAAMIKISSHSLKSSFNLIGAVAIAQLCQVLETMAQEGKTSNAHEIFQQIRMLFEDVVRDLNQWKIDIESNA